MTGAQQQRQAEAAGRDGASPAAPGWSLAVFASRESAEVLEATLRAALAAATPGMVIDVLVNGNAELSRRAAQELAPRLPLPGPGVRLRVWSIAFGDKSNAWNRYLHDVWSGEALAFFIDGYVRLMPDALQRLGDAVLADAHALGGSGVSHDGTPDERVAPPAVRPGGFNGNLCCMKAWAVAEFKRQGIRLPVGLYRGDAVIGALLLYDMDPVGTRWADRRILVHGQARYLTDPKRWWRWSDAVSAAKRTLRQAKGELENKAVRGHMTLRKRAPNLLAPTARALVLGWAAEFPSEFRSTWLRSPLSYWAYRRLRQQGDEEAAGAAADRSARLLWSSTA
jgi:hypothetical protein